MSCGENAVVSDSGFNGNFGAWVAKSFERFIRTQGQSDWSFSQTREGNCNRLILDSTFGAITTTDIRHHYPYATQREIEYTRDLLSKRERSLTTAPNSQLLALKVSHRRV